MIIKYFILFITITNVLSEITEDRKKILNDAAERLTIFRYAQRRYFDSFGVVIADNNEDETFRKMLDKNANKEESEKLKREYILLRDIVTNIRNVYTNEEELEYLRLMSSSREMELETLLENGLIRNWPFYIYDDVARDIYTPIFSRIPLLHFDYDISMPSTEFDETVFPEFKEEKDKQKDRNKQEKYFFGKMNSAPKELTCENPEELPNNFRLARHHILPYATLHTFYRHFNNLHRLESINSKTSTMFTNARNTAVKRLRIASVLKEAEKYSDQRPEGERLRSYILINANNYREHKLGLWLWNPGNIVIGPEKRFGDKSKNDKTKDSGKFTPGKMDDKLKPFISEDEYNELNRIHNEMIDVTTIVDNIYNQNNKLLDDKFYNEVTNHNGENLYYKMNNLDTDFLRITEKINNGNRGLYGIKFNIKFWKENGKKEWYVDPPSDYNKIKEYKKDDGNNPPDGSSYSLTGACLAIAVVHGSNRIKRDAHLNESILEDLKFSNYLVNYAFLHNKSNIFSEWTKEISKSNTSYYSLNDYVKNNIQNKSSGVYKLLNSLCSKDYTTTQINQITSTEKYITRFERREQYHSCKVKTMTTGLLVGTGGGCAGGAAIGAWFFGIGALPGCGIGALAMGAIGLFGGSGVVAPQIC